MIVLFFVPQRPCLPIFRSIGLLVFDRPHLTFNFVAGIILMFFGLVISTLGICHLKPEPII